MTYYDDDDYDIENEDYSERDELDDDSYCDPRDSDLNDVIEWARH